MNRRAFVTGLGAVLVAPPAAESQPARRVAFLCAFTCSSLNLGTGDWDQAFIRGLGQSGFPGGRNVEFDMRAAGTNGDEGLPDAARQLVSRKPDVIVAFGNAAARAARRTTTTIPIVMVLVTDPVEDGLISSLARPGSNITGLA